MKKIINKGLLSALSILTLAACGAPEESSEEVGELTTSESEASSEVFTISVDGERYTEFINQIKGDFEEEHGVTIEVDDTPMFDQLESLPLDGPAGIGPDAMMAPYDRAGGLGTQGHLLGLDLPEDSRYDEKSVNMVTVDGEQYAAPFVLETLVLYYNTDHLEEAPETFEELEALSDDPAFAFEGEEGKSVGFLANWVDLNQAYGLLAGYGGYVFGEDGQNPEDIGLNTAGAIEGIEYIQTWYEDVWPQGMKDASSAGDFKNQSFMNGENAANIAGTWMNGDFRDSGVNYSVSAIPTLPNGEPYQPFAGGKGWIISNYTENPEVGQAWIEYVTNAENSQLFYEISAELPVNLETQASITEAGDDPLAMAAYAQFESASPMPIIPEMAEVWIGAETMLFDVAAGNKTAEESANDAVEVIKENISQKY